ncbi:MAG: c-type cytochrome [Candidatus Acidiferrales bacterium]
MQRIIWRTAPVALVVFLASLAFPSGLRAQSVAANYFKANCTLCHGEDGGADTPTGKALKAKDLRSDVVQKQTDAELNAVITKGRGKMPAFGGKASPDMIKSLVAYVRTLPEK